MNAVAPVLLNAALELAAAGLPVFPCAANKRPCIPKDEGGDGFKDATTDPDVIRRLFSHAGARLIGVPTGQRSGFDVLDLDYRHGAKAWEDAEQHRLPETRTHQTQSGGRHLLFQRREGLRNSAGKIAPGVDVRAEGGYIVAPPSAGYRIISDAEVAPWPEWLVELARKRDPAPTRPVTKPTEPISSRRLNAYIEKQLTHVRGASDGQKRDTLRRSARAIGGVVEQAGLSDDSAIALLLNALPATVLNWNLARDTAAWAIGEGRKVPIILEDRLHSKRPRRGGSDLPPDLDEAYWAAVEVDAGAAPKPNRRRAKSNPDPDAAPADAPQIQVRVGELHVAATEAEDAILQSGLPVYQRSKWLVRPISREVPASRGRTTIAAGLGEIELHGLVDILSGCAQFQKYDARAKDLVRINPPSSVVQIMLSRYGAWRAPHVAGVITTPSLRPDGSVLSEPGYDAATRLYHVPDPELTIAPEVLRPTRKAAETAITLLEALLIEFPFTTPVARSVALSAILTPVVGGALSVKPLHVFRANTAGSGKSYLVDIVSTISTGRPCPVISVAPDEAETEKRLTGLLLGGYPLVSLDNVNGELGGDLLCQAVERPFIRLRRLGASDIIEIESCVTILATGNNARVRGDMVRRTLMCDLDPQMERPELREFTGNPVATIAADRSRYVSACLTIVRAYIEAGKPNLPKPLASYEDWSSLVRGALIWLGYSDPVDSMEAAREDDPDLGELRDMIQAWHFAFGTDALTCRDAIDACNRKKAPVDDEGDPMPHAAATELCFPDLADTLLRVAGMRGVVDPKRLGMWFDRNKGKIVGNWRFSRPQQGGQGGVARWRLETIKR